MRRFVVTGIAFLLVAAAAYLPSAGVTSASNDHVTLTSCCR